MTTASSTDTVRSLIITRTFDAPRELVFSAWTDPERMMGWWGPTDFTGVASEIDLQAGGVWRACMRSPDGVDHWTRGIYHVIDAPARLVMSFAWEAPDAIETLITLTFDSHGDSTTMTFHQGIFETPGSRDGHRDGWEAAFDKLAANVKAARDHDSKEFQMNTTNTGTGKEVTITRTFNAPRDLVFKAWTDPTLVAQWWGPNGFTNPVCEMDVRSGGAILIHMQGPDGAVYPMQGVFDDVAPPKRLVFTASALASIDGPFLLEDTTTVTFAEQDGKTTVTVQAVVTKAVPEAVGALDGMEEGWNQTLDSLGEYLASTATTDPIA